MTDEDTGELPEIVTGPVDHALIDVLVERGVGERGVISAWWNANRDQIWATEIEPALQSISSWLPRSFIDKARGYAGHDEKTVDWLDRLNNCNDVEEMRRILRERDPGGLIE